jgi:hypothetical protein
VGFRYALSALQKNSDKIRLPFKLVLLHYLIFPLLKRGHHICINVDREI